MNRAEQARLLRSAASALEHGRLRTASKKIEQALGGPLVIFVEGGLVQDVGRVSDTGFVSAEYDIVDYDILDGSSNEEVKEYFERRSPEVVAYMKKFLPDEYEKFQERIREVEDKSDGVGMEIFHCDFCDAELEEGRIGKCDDCLTLQKNSE